MGKHDPENNIFTQVLTSKQIVWKRHLKESGTTYWLAGNEGTNDYNFDGRGSGYRYSGTIMKFKDYSPLLTDEEYDLTDAKCYDLWYDNHDFVESQVKKTDSCPVRLIKD